MERSLSSEQGSHKASKQDQESVKYISPIEVDGFVYYYWRKVYYCFP